MISTNNISATIIQDSISSEGIRITTFELEYPRFIHSELMTHRLFSRNAASSRAVPIEKMIEHVSTKPAAPIHWGKNQAGMSAKEELAGEELVDAQHIWKTAAQSAATYSKMLHTRNVHKQIANRLTEPFQVMKTIVTATNFSNWFWLRDHPDAQPEICDLAKKMIFELNTSFPHTLKPGEWHVPYVNRGLNEFGNIVYYSGQDNKLFTIDEARMVSASCCAQVSYRKSDDTLQKAEMVFDRLVNSSPVHASPVEHQATPMKFAKLIFEGYPEGWEEGVTHVNRDRMFCSGNFTGWIQYRQLIPNQSK